MITTENDIIQIIKDLGVKPDDICVAHASLSSFGYVVNGARDYIEAYLNYLGNNGTLVMSGNCNQLCEPSEWKSMKLTEEEILKIRASQKIYDKRKTVVTDRGIVPQYLVNFEGTKRSDHPVKSILANGKLAEYICKDHPLKAPEGKGSPLYKCYINDAITVLNGVDMTSASIIHTAEYLSNLPYMKENLFSFLKDENLYTKLDTYPKSSKGFNILLEHSLFKPLINRVSYNNSYHYSFHSKNLINLLVDYLKESPYFLIKS